MSLLFAHIPSLYYIQTNALSNKRTTPKGENEGDRARHGRGEAEGAGGGGVGGKSDHFRSDLTLREF